MPYYVQVYRSTDLNSPPLSGQSNSGIVCLNACLVDGYSGSMSITALTRSGSTATATTSAADGLKLKTGQYLTISGAVETDYNITAIITVASTTQFTYTVAGTPTTPATGTIVGSLKLPITTITRGGAGNLTATVTMSISNQTLITGNYLTIQGCTGTGNAQYNGTFQITVTGTTTFTYQMVSDPTASASGSPVYFKSGLQWTRPFAAGTNSQTYLSQATLGATGESYTPRYLQVIDNAATAGLGREAQVYGAEIMSADQTITLGQFPTTVQNASGLCFRKSSTASSVIREWTVWGDEKTFLLGSNTGETQTFHGFGFGYFISTKINDAYNTFIGGGALFNAASNFNNGMFGMGWLANAIVTASFYLARSHTQVGSSISSALSGASTGTTTSTISSAGQQFVNSPNQSNSGYYVQPIFIQDGVGVLRGRLPGMYGSLNGLIITNYDTITNVVGLSGITLLGVSIMHFNVNGIMLVDQFGPWI